MPAVELSVAIVAVAVSVATTSVPVALAVLLAMAVRASVVGIAVMLALSVALVTVDVVVVVVELSVAVASCLKAKVEALNVIREAFDVSFSVKLAYINSKGKIRISAIIEALLELSEILNKSDMFFVSFPKLWDSVVAFVSCLMDFKNKGF